MNSKGSINLFLIPSENRNNKYISLLASSLSKADSKIKTIALKNDSLFGIIPYLMRGRISGAKNIIHIQWSTVLYGSRFLVKSAVALLANFSLIVFLKLFFRFRIIWTVHNFYAHDYKHPSVDYIGRLGLFSLADCILVQQRSTLSSYMDRFPGKRVEYVPHGNYIDAYGPNVSVNYSLRRSFGFEDDDIVLLSLGAIAPYKMNEKIIDAFTVARKKNPKLKLLIAGKGDAVYAEKLSLYAPANSGIIIRNSFVPDEDLPAYLSATDYSVFYYDRSEMTSGGVILSMSYGVPVITRDIPGAEVVSEKSGYIFTDESGLVSILEHLKYSRNPDSAAEIIKEMRKFDWSELAGTLVRIYENL